MSYEYRQHFGIGLIMFSMVFFFAAGAANWFISTHAALVVGAAVWVGSAAWFARIATRR